MLVVTFAEFTERKNQMPGKKKPIVVSVINMKGGVGKSTISALLCRYGFTVKDLDILAIDLDPQANLSQAFMRNKYKDFLRNHEPSIVELFNGYFPPSKSKQSPFTINRDMLTQQILSYENHSLELIP